MEHVQLLPCFLTPGVRTTLLVPSTCAFQPFVAGMLWVEWRKGFPLPWVENRRDWLWSWTVTSLDKQLPEASILGSPGHEACWLPFHSSAVTRCIKASLGIHSCFFPPLPEGAHLLYTGWSNSGTYKCNHTSDLQVPLLCLSMTFESSL